MRQLTVFHTTIDGQDCYSGGEKRLDRAPSKLDIG